MPNQGIPGSAVTSHDCTDQPLVTQLTWIGDWWVAKKWGFMLWPRGKQDLTSQGQKCRTHLQPTDLFFPVPREQMNDDSAQLQNVVSIWRSPVQIPMQAAEKEVTACNYSLTLYPGYK